MKRIGWVGIIYDKPHFEDTVDDYTENGSSIPSAIVYKSKKAALKRYEAVREVFLGEE